MQSKRREEQELKLLVAEVDKDLYNQFKVKVAKNQTTIKYAITSLIKDYLEK